MRKPYLVSTLVALFVGGGLSLMVAHAQTRVQNAAGATADGKLPPLPGIDSPEVEDALQKSRELLKTLEDHQGRLDFSVEKMQLPGRWRAEKPFFRGDRVGSFTMMRTDERAMEDVAFYSDIYVRRPAPRSDTATSKERASGFYIVGFRDGRVDAVPVERVRVVYVPNRPRDDPSARRMAILFPGSAHYRDRSFEEVGRIP